MDLRYLLLKGGEGGVERLHLRYKKGVRVVFKVIKRSDIQILLKDLKG